MTVWIFIVSGVLIVFASSVTLAMEVMASHMYHTLRTADSPLRPTWKRLFSYIFMYSCLGTAGTWIGAIQQSLKTPASAPPSIVYRELQPIYMTPPPQDATANPKNALTKVDPPSDKFAQQDVPPISPSELAEQKRLADARRAEDQRLADARLAEEKRLAEAQKLADARRAEDQRLADAKLAKERDDELKRQIFASIHRDLRIP